MGEFGGLQESIGVPSVRSLLFFFLRDAQKEHLFEDPGVASTCETTKCTIGNERQAIGNRITQIGK